MKQELNCKWHFAERNGDGDDGPNSAMSQTFSQFPCSALVRESIQNSLDAVLNPDRPVVVCFEYRAFEKEDYPNFFDLSTHIQACYDYYRNNPSAKAIYPAMLSQLKKASEIGFIRVSDFNTKGMDYEYEQGPTQTNKTFYAFVRSVGVSVKQAEGAGGSFGFGKGAFFVMSPLNTLLVSTCNNQGECYFEGVTRLCSHAINDVMYSHMGFYDNNQGQPTNDKDSIPIPFRRSEAGTSIGIMGIEHKDWNAAKNELTKEVLSNFFAAILEKKLIVYIDGNPNSPTTATVINGETITDLMRDKFPTTKDVNRISSFNPRPYFEAMTDSVYHLFEEELPTLGNVKLYLKEFEDNVTQIIFLRKLLMKVFRSRRNQGNYNGVFICENEIGNKILGDMEDPEHKAWSPEECKKPEVKTSYETACSAQREIEDFINRCLDELQNINPEESVQISGLDKYLPSLDAEKGKGEKGNPFTGKPTGQYVKEGSSLTTEGVLKPVPDKKRRQKGQVTEITPGDFTKTDDGNVIAGTGGDGNNGQDGNKIPGDNYGRGIIEDGKGAYKRLIDVDWRPIQSFHKKGYMDIVIYSSEDVKSAELTFQIGRETRAIKEEKDDITIVYSNKGEVQGLKIKNVELKAGNKNIVQIAFSDNLVHTLNLFVYEVD